jgi:ABC-2 type transport system permease protein
MNLTTAFLEIYKFFFRQELKSKRTRIFFFISLIPVVVLLLAKVVEMGNPDPEVTAAQIFSRVLLIVYIQLLIPVLALVYGGLIVNEEVDQKTLVFLTTSPIPKPSVILGKYAAYATLSAITVNIGLILCFFIINFDRLSNMLYVKEFLSFMGAGVLALFAYMGLFTLMGAIMKKSMVLGLLFIFLWENIVQYLPGVTQKFTVIHYIKSLLPYSGGKASFLHFLMARTQPSSTAGAVIMLLLILVATLAMASYVFQKKEYILSDAA